MSKESPKSVNELYAWGYNKFGQLGTGDTTNRLTPQIVGFFNDKKLKKIDAGEYHSLALTETGDLYAWGTNANGELGITGSYQLTPQLVPFFSGKKSSSGCDRRLSLASFNRVRKTICMGLQ
jgi:alpha-tubulin suppressor-like RCC1 family protein